MNLVYIDVMRMVAPIETLDRHTYDFFLLGGFDAMWVNTSLKTIQGLQEKHKERYRVIPSHYERQPLYLYARVAAKQTLFKRDGDHARRPLVMCSQT